jgi:hypothetical protein
MKSLAVYLTLLLSTLIIHVHCAYPVIIEDDKLPLLPYLYSASTIVHNNTVYSYGGVKSSQLNGTDKLFSYTLEPSTGKMTVRLENEGQGPICTYCNAVLFPNSTEMLVLSEPNYNESSIFYTNHTMFASNQTVLPHFYDLIKRTWRVAPPKTMNGQNQTFFGRVYNTVVMNGNDGVYILGGLYHSLSHSNRTTTSGPLPLGPDASQNQTTYDANADFNGTYYYPNSYSNSSTYNPTGYTSDLRKRDVEHDTVDSAGNPLITDGWYYNRHDESYTAISLPKDLPFVDPMSYINL